MFRPIKKIKLIFVLLMISFVLIACQKKITDDDINRIVSEKNIDEITWKDFDPYLFQEDKSHGLVRIYTLDNGSTLILSGSSDSDKPSSISIVEINGNTTFLKDENSTQ